MVQNFRFYVYQGRINDFQLGQGEFCANHVEGGWRRPIRALFGENICERKKEMGPLGLNGWWDGAPPGFVNVYCTLGPA